MPVILEPRQWRQDEVLGHPELQKERTSKTEKIKFRAPVNDCPVLKDE